MTRRLTSSWHRATGRRSALATGPVPGSGHWSPFKNTLLRFLLDFKTEHDKGVWGMGLSLTEGWIRAFVAEGSGVLIRYGWLPNSPRILMLAFADLPVHRALNHQGYVILTAIAKGKAYRSF